MLSCLKTLVDDDEVLHALKDSLLMVLSESQVWHPEHESTKMQNTASVQKSELETIQGNQLRIM